MAVSDRSRTNSEFDSIRGEYRFFECRKTGSQTESKNRFIRFFPYRYTTLITRVIESHVSGGIDRSTDSTRCMCSARFSVELVSSLCDTR